MKMNIEKIDIKVTAIESENLVGFADAIFLNKDEQMIFKVVGFTIKLKTFNKLKDPVLCVDPPAFRSKKGKDGYKRAFYIDDKILWRTLADSILDAFCEKTGSERKKNQLGENVSPDEIPF